MRPRELVAAWVEAFNRGNPDEMAAFYAEHAVNHQVVREPVEGRAAIRAFIRFIEYRVPAALEQVQRIRAIPMKRTDTRLVNHLNREEMQALLDAGIATRRGIMCIR